MREMLLSGECLRIFWICAANQYKEYAESKQRDVKQRRGEGSLRRLGRGKFVGGLGGVVLGVASVEMEPTGGFESILRFYGG